MDRVIRKPVVLIGGASGVGKSSLAGELSHRFSFDHRLGTGFIRAILQSQSHPDVEPLLFSHTFSAEDAIAHLEWQSRRLHTAVSACIDRAHREGTSIVIEGTHLIPNLYTGSDVDLFFVLAAPSPAEHHGRLTGSSHTHRQISTRDWDNIRAINDYYLDEASRLGVATVVYKETTLDEINDLVHPHLE